MSDRTVIKYRIHCTTTNTDQCAWLQSIDPPLNYCPENSQHSVNLSSLAIIDTITTSEVKIKEEEKNVTQGIYKFQGYDVAIASGNIGDITPIAISWPRDISIINGWFYSTEEQMGDFIDANVTAIVGVVVSNISTNDNTFYVNSTVLDNIYKGFNVKITNFATNSDRLGEIMSINTGNSTITTSGESSHDYTLAQYGGFTPYVEMTGRVIQDLKITCPFVRYAFAEKKLGGRSLPANTTLVLNYENNSGNAKNFTFQIEYLY